MHETTSAEMVVVRMSPWGAESLQNSMSKQALGDIGKGRPPKYGISVYATCVQPDETFDDAVARLCEAITPGFTNGDRIAVTSAASLAAAGYALHLDEPPKDHHLIGGDDLSSPTELENLVAEFKQRRPNPAWKGD